MVGPYGNPDDRPMAHLWASIYMYIYTLRPRRLAHGEDASGTARSATKSGPNAAQCIWQEDSRGYPRKASWCQRFCDARFCTCARRAKKKQHAIDTYIYIYTYIYLHIMDAHTGPMGPPSGFPYGPTIGEPFGPMGPRGPTTRGLRVAHGHVSGHVYIYIYIYINLSIHDIYK
jgi:hypothetical protein